MSRQSLKNVARLINLETKEVPVEEQFRLDLCRSIEMDDQRGWRLPSKTFKPSSMQCQRSSYYQIIGQEPDKGESSYSMVGICNSGTDIHERVQSAVSRMAENGMECQYVDVGGYVKSRGLEDLVIRERKGFETKLYNQKYNISFMLDGIILYRGKYYILEIKTETNNKWYNRTGVDSKHYNQAIAYSLSLQIDNVIFLYVDRNMLNYKTFLFQVTDDMRQNLVGYIEEVNGYVERKIAPPKPSDIDRRVCNYCGYKNVCKYEKG